MFLCSLVIFFFIFFVFFFLFYVMYFFFFFFFYCDSTVRQVLVKPGDTVAAKDLLIVLE